VRTSKARVLRVMREAGLLAPTRIGHAPGPAVHDGIITTEVPDQMWGMDATSCLTRQEGTATVFVVVDHCASECIGLHAAKPGTRFEAVEPLRQGLRAIFGSYAEGIAAGLPARHDHGSQYVSDYFQDELTFLGITSSPAFVREPEGNGVAERFIRTLKEQLLWVRSFATVEELRVALLEFKDRYNRAWLCERHDHQTPAAVRMQRSRRKAA
jgi:putative transposase